MGFWMAAAPIAASVLGGLSGKQKKKAANQTVTTSRTITPPTQLGGWDRVNEILKGLGTAPQYRPGANNPYLSAGMSHLFNRAGIQGDFGNPYLNPMPQATPPPQPQQGGGGPMQFTPEMIERLRQMQQGMP